MTDLNLACFFAGTFVGILGALALIIWAATRLKRVETAELEKKAKKETE